MDTDFSDNATIFFIEAKFRKYCFNAFQEESDCGKQTEFLLLWKQCEIGKRQRRHKKSMFTRDPQALTAGNQDLEASTGPKQVNKCRSRFYHLFKVIEQKEQMLLFEKCY